MAFRLKPEIKKAPLPTTNHELQLQGLNVIVSICGDSFGIIAGSTYQRFTSRAIGSLTMAADDNWGIISLSDMTVIVHQLDGRGVVSHLDYNACEIVKHPLGPYVRNCDGSIHVNIHIGYGNAGPRINASWGFPVKVFDTVITLITEASGHLMLTTLNAAGVTSVRAPQISTDSFITRIAMKKTANSMISAL